VDPDELEDLIQFDNEVLVVEESYQVPQGFDKFVLTPCKRARSPSPPAGGAGSV
jgi:hypothetical protein